MHSSPAQRQPMTFRHTRVFRSSTRLLVTPISLLDTRHYQPPSPLTVTHPLPSTDAGHHGPLHPQRVPRARPYAYDQPLSLPQPPRQPLKRAKRLQYPQSPTQRRQRLRLQGLPSQHPVDTNGNIRGWQEL